jgi:hypothetical protein
VLRNKGIITSRQYEDAVKERRATGDVELALNQEWSRKEGGACRAEAGERGHQRFLLDSRRLARDPWTEKEIPVRASTKAIVAVFALGLAASVATPAAVGQDKPSESGPLDPRLKPLVGTWEGRVELKMSREEQGRTLVIRERGGARGTARREIRHPW